MKLALLSLLVLSISLSIANAAKPFLGDKLGTCKQMRTRREIRDLTPSQRSLFFDAFLKLHSSGILSKFTRTHMRAIGVYDHVHASPQFLPFHRAFLREFEDALSPHLPPGFGIPYWDSGIDAHDMTQSVLFTSPFIGRIDTTTGKIIDSPFSHDKYIVTEPHKHALIRNYGAGACVGYSHLIMEDYLSTSSFSEFSNKLEVGPHNIVHSCIGGSGGDMRTHFSPNDILFILHHSYIDMLWHNWQMKSPRHSKFGTETYTKPEHQSMTQDTLLAYYDIPIGSVMNLDDLCVAYYAKGKKAGEGSDRGQDSVALPVFPEDWFQETGRDRKEVDTIMEKVEEIVEKVNVQVFHKIPKAKKTKTAQKTTPTTLLNGLGMVRDERTLILTKTQTQTLSSTSHVLRSRSATLSQTATSTPTSHSSPIYTSHNIIIILFTASLVYLL